MTKRIYGWQRQNFDSRDLGFAMVSPIKLPSSVDLRKEMPAVYDQGPTNSCIEHAVAGSLQHAMQKAGMPVIMPSRLFMYWNTRFLEGTLNEDAGGFIRDCIKSCNNAGYCEEQLWPFDPTKITVKPPQEAFDEAIEDRIHFYGTVNNLNILAFKEALAHGNPVIFGFDVYPAMEEDGPGSVADPAWARLSMPVPGQRKLGGHGVLGVGYRDDIECAIVRNSWGSAWGDNGCFYMPYEYIASEMVADAWVIRLK